MRTSICKFRRRLIPVLFLFSIAVSAQTAKHLELSRPVRNWEFLPVVGQRAALLGTESGKFEAWVYPLKLFTNFRLNFLLANRVLPAEGLARTVIVHPESSTIVYSSDTFSVRETLFVPVHEQGAVIIFEISTVEPLEIEAAFERDFQLEWPAALGGTYINWDGNLHAFSFGEEKKKYAALLGSPTASDYRQEYSTNYSSSLENSLRLGVTSKGSDTKVLVIAGSSAGTQEAENTYRHLIADNEQLRGESEKYYADYLDRTVSLDLPDEQLRLAYDWSRISMAQGMVANPELGTGLIAGYRTSGASQRPGFAWFFGRDSMWTSLALTASGDFTTSHTALEFISKYQRADGKIPHEISQTANLVDWFNKYPYGYASADATPLYIIAADDYVTQSGDTHFIKEKWDSLWKAYEFLRSTYDSQGLPQNFGIGHGWIEGGPLLPVKSELYQAGLGATALRSLSHLAELGGKHDISKQLLHEFTNHKNSVNELFWSGEKKFFSFALDTKDAKVDIPTVLTTVPMWFGVLDESKSEQTIDVLAEADHQTDWGMRIISSNNPVYNPGGYHFGSVWPLFTGWASVGEYRYHRPFPAYANLRANALLALNGSLGHVTEVLSGDFNEPISTSSPHQIWSAAMVVSPILRGLLGLNSDAITHTLQFRPHVPANWTSFALHNIPFTHDRIDIEYKATSDEIVLELRRTGNGDGAVEFAPAISPRAKVISVAVDGRTVKSQVDRTNTDQHVLIRVPIKRDTTTVRIKTRGDFGISGVSVLPPLGGTSTGLRVVSESWSVQKDSLSLKLEGAAGHEYELFIRNPSQISQVEGAELKCAGENTRLSIKFPQGNPKTYLPLQLTIHFKKDSND